MTDYYDAVPTSHGTLSIFPTKLGTIALMLHSIFYTLVLACCFKASALVIIPLILVHQLVQKSLWKWPQIGAEVRADRGGSGSEIDMRMTKTEAFYRWGLQHFHTLEQKNSSVAKKITLLSCNWGSYHFHWCDITYIAAVLERKTNPVSFSLPSPTLSTTGCDEWWFLCHICVIRSR